MENQKINHYIVSANIERLSSTYNLAVSVIVDDVNKPILPTLFSQYVKEQLLKQYSVEATESEINLEFISWVGKNY